MVERFASLFGYEREALLAALRRDAKSQLALAAINADDADYYMFNYRAVIRLLDVLSPKEGHRSEVAISMPSRADAEIGINEAA